MNKLREKLVIQALLPYSLNRHFDEWEKITDDFTIAFTEWLNIQYRELNHTLAFKEKTLPELLIDFKNDVYGK